MKFTSLHNVPIAALLLLKLSTAVAQRANVLNKLPSCGDDGCHCNGAAECPDLPTISSTTLANFKALQHVNPMRVRCDPFLSAQCVENPVTQQPSLESGEACVVEMIAPLDGAGESCPSGYSYR